MHFCNNNMRTFIIVVFSLIMSFGMPVAFVSAQIGTSPSSQPIGTSPGVTLINPLSSGNCNSTNSDCLENFLVNILRFVVRIGGIIVVLMYVYVGFKFVTAQGAETKVTEAKKMLLWTTIGALVLLGAQVIAMGIKATVENLTS